MARGEPTSEDVVALFRAHYLHSGNVSASSREVDIPISTGREIAKRLRAEESFAKDREELRARALDDLIVMRMQVAEEAFARFTGKDDAIEEIVKGENVTIIDKRQDYGKLVLEAEKNAHHLTKINTGTGDEKPTEVHITVSGPDGQAP